VSKASRERSSWPRRSSVSKTNFQWRNLRVGSSTQLPRHPRSSLIIARAPKLLTRGLGFTKRSLLTASHHKSSKQCQIWGARVWMIPGHLSWFLSWTCLKLKGNSTRRMLIKHFSQLRRQSLLWTRNWLWCLCSKQLKLSAWRSLTPCQRTPPPVRAWTLSCLRRRLRFSSTTFKAKGCRVTLTTSRQI